MWYLTFDHAQLFIRSLQKLAGIFVLITRSRRVGSHFAPQRKSNRPSHDQIVPSKTTMHRPNTETRIAPGQTLTNIYIYG